MATLTNLADSMPNLMELEVGQICPRQKNDSRHGFLGHLREMKLWDEIKPHKNLRKLKFATVFSDSKNENIPTVASQILPFLTASFPKLSLVIVVKT